MTPEETVRAFFDCYTNGDPDGFAKVVSPDYTDYGHEPPGRGVQGAIDDFEHAQQVVGGLTAYAVDAAVTDGDAVAAAWTGTLPDGTRMSGLSLYRVVEGYILSTRHTRLPER